MSIKYFGEKENVFEITGKNWRELQKVMKKYDIHSEAKTLGFLIAVGLQGDGEPFRIDGNKIEPSDEIRI